MAEEREFPPSEHKLETLREQGVYPVSANLASAGIITGVALSLLMLWPSLLGRWSTLFQNSLGREQSITQDPLFVVLEIAEQIFRLSVLPVLGIALFALFIGLFQSRFLIRFTRRRGFVGDFGQRLSGAAFSRNFLYTLIGMMIVLLWFMAVVLFCRSTLSQERIWITAFSTKSFEMLPYYFEATKSVLLPLLWTACAFSISIGVVSRVFAVLQFRRDHRMTRGEVEAEQRETEGSPQMASARRERSGD